MAETIFDGDVSGYIFDADTSTIVGTSNGSGTIIQVGWTLASGSTYTFKNCSEIQWHGLVSRVCPTNSTVRILGVSTMCTLKAWGAATWNGFRLDTGVHFSAENCTFTQVGNTPAAGYTGVISVGEAAARTGLHDDIIVDCSQCIFHEDNEEAVLDAYCRDNNRFYFTGCEMRKDSVAGDTVSHGLFLQAHATMVLPNRVVVDYCTIYWSAVDTGATVRIAKAVNAGSVITLTNSLLTVENTDGVEVAEIVSNKNAGGTPTAGSFQSGYNMCYVYTDPWAPGDLPVVVTDQLDVDPGFNSVPDDLAPDGTAGSPALENMNSDGYWSGALAPYNATVATVGTTALYGEAKQRIYEKSFGVNPSRGRGIRMRMTSRDKKSLKTVAGLWLRHGVEEPK